MLSGLIDPAVVFAYDKERIASFYILEEEAMEDNRDPQMEKLIGAVYDCSTPESVLERARAILWQRAEQLSNASPDQIGRLEMALRSQAERYGGTLPEEVSIVLLRARRAATEREDTARRRKNRKKKRIFEFSELFSGLFHGAGPGE